MSVQFGAAAGLAAKAINRLSIFILLITTVSLAIFTLGGVLGQWPHLQIMARIGDGPALDMGLWLQGAATLLLVSLCAVLPFSARILKLESEHRAFSMNMEDIARAYHASHAADRAGLFTAKSEFDSVRARLKHLRDHPDLGRLEPELLETAAQMSHISQDLAEIYSDDKMDRARRFLQEREAEIALFNDRLDEARTAAEELRQWTKAVEIDEALARNQVERIRAELIDLMPELFGDEPATPTDPATIARLHDQILHVDRPFHADHNPFDFDGIEAEAWKKGQKRNGRAPQGQCASGSGSDALPRPLLEVARRAAE